MVKNILLIILLSTLLSACASMVPKTVYRTVYQPYYVIVKIPVVPKPKLPIYSLTAAQKNDPSVLGPAYVESLRLALNYASLLSYEINYNNCLADNYNYSMTNYMNFDSTLNRIVSEYVNTKSQLTGSLEATYGIKCQK